MLKNPFFITGKPATRQIVVTFSAPPTGLVLEPCTLRYGKQHVVTYDQDDNLAGVYKSVFPLLMGGSIPEFDTEVSPGRFFNDGFGGQVNMKASTHSWVMGTTVNYWDWAQDGAGSYADHVMNYERLDEFMANGFGLNSHGYYKTMDGKSTQEVIEAAQLYADWMEGMYGVGFRPLNCGAPGGQTFDQQAWSDAWFALGALIGSLATSSVVYMPLNVDTTQLTGQMLIDRTSMDNKSLDTVKGYVDTLVGKPDPSLLRLFSHTITNDGTFADYAVIRGVFDYIQNTYADELWVPSVNELVRYMHVRDRIVFGQNIEGNVLTITFDESAIPSFIVRRALTFKVSANEVITSVNVSGYRSRKNGEGTTEAVIDLEW